MPTPQQHITQHARNEAFFQHLSSSSFTDWAITALFYAALHLIDAWLPPPTRTRRHVDRVREIIASPHLAAVQLHYRELKQRSEDARYDCVTFTAADVRAIYAQHYLPLRQHVRGLLGI